MRTQKQVGSKVTNYLRYRGYVYDEDTTLYYLQTRYYDPTTGRFINADDTAFIGSSGTAIGDNIYTYCENNPVNNVDPCGQCCFSDNTTLIHCYKSNKYNPKKAIEYAQKWYDKHNPQYPDFDYKGGDCANFVSQCLHYGGLNMSKNWYCIKSSYWKCTYTQYWTVASKNYAYFARSKFVRKISVLYLYKLSDDKHLKFIKKIK
jgi:RHS repeat-associated protein